MIWKEIIKQLPKSNYPLVIGISGINAAGKTHFAKTLGRKLANEGKQVRVIGLDSFKLSEEARTTLDCYDPDTYLTKWFDFQSFYDRVVDAKKSDVDVVLVEGLFLFKAPILEELNYKIYLQIGKDVAHSRITARDIPQEGTEMTERKWKERSMPAQEKFHNEHNPKDCADLVIDNTDFTNPKIHLP
tara:strand:+ start:5902 stop:6462 length:561 start_codon:yes stop_codon:yes gene_type:complete